MEKETIDTGLLPQCYMDIPECKERSKVKISKGEHKGKFVYICYEGCSIEERDCQFDKQA